jgi:predicted metal-binding protein
MPAGSRKTTRRKRAGLDAFLRRAGALGAARARVIRASAVVVAEGVRWKCRYGCDGYVTNLACPPHSPAPESTRRLLAGYRRAILLEAGRRRVREIVPELEREIFLAGFHRALGLCSGPCRLCGECPLTPPCRNSERSRPAMEACGIDVFSTVRGAGWTIDVVRTHRDTAHFFGLVLVD